MVEGLVLAIQANLCLDVYIRTQGFIGTYHACQHHDDDPHQP